MLQSDIVLLLKTCCRKPRFLRIQTKTRIPHQNFKKLLIKSENVLNNGEILEKISAMVTDFFQNLTVSISFQG